MRNCPTVLILDVKPHCGLLELDVSNCFDMDNQTMKCLCSCSTLQAVACGFCSKLTDNAISDLIRSTSLLSLDLNNCNFQTLHFQAPNLVSLILDGCKNLSLDTFHSLSAHCFNLANISMRACASITDQFIDSLTVRWPSLVKINLSRCNLITDQAINLLSQRCLQLQFCDISWCEQLTNLSLIYISQHLNKLVHLNCLKAFGCSFTSEAINPLLRRIKQVGSNLTLQIIQVNKATSLNNT